MTLDRDKETEQMWASIVPLGRLAEVDELKGSIMPLASPASNFTTGTACVIDGGPLAR